VSRAAENDPMQCSEAEADEASMRRVAMNIMKGLGVSLLCALLASGVWAGAAYASGWSLGLLMLVVGSAAGIGMKAGLSGRGGVGPGLLAGLIAVVAIFAGSAAAGRLMAEDFLDEELAAISDGPTLLAGEVYDEFIRDDRPISENDDDVWAFPPEVLAEARERWEAMTADEREARLGEARADFDTNRDASAGFLTILGVIAMLGIKGLIVMLFAVGAAFQIAASDSKPDETQSETIEPPTTASADFFGALGREASVSAANDSTTTAPAANPSTTETRAA
jgi:hypothetical protein